MHQVQREQDRTAAARAAGERYSAVAILFHWLIALFLVAAVVLGLRMEDLRGPDQFAVFQLHKSIGITVLLLTLLRLAWRLHRKPPPLLIDGWERRLAELVHGLFYVALVGLPLSGWLIVSTSPTRIPTLLYGLLPWPHVPLGAGLSGGGKATVHVASEQMHHFLGWLTYALIFLHVAGALKHHFRDTAPSLARMAPGARAGSWIEPRLLAIAALVAAVVAAALAYRQAGEAGPTPATPSPVSADGKRTAPTRLPRAFAPVPPTQETAEEKQAGEAPAKEQAPVPRWIVDSGSAIGFRTAWGSQPIHGGFREWTAAISFAPEALDRSHVEVTVDTASAFTGDAQRDSALRGEDWFASASITRATFSAERFERRGEGLYRARGTLRLRGIARPVSLPFALTISGDRAVMTARLDLDRTAFGIGRGEFAGTDQVPALVAVDIRVEARRAHP